MLQVLQKQSTAAQVSESAFPVSSVAQEIPQKTSKTSKKKRPLSQNEPKTSKPKRQKKTPPASSSQVQIDPKHGDNVALYYANELALTGKGSDCESVYGLHPMKECLKIVADAVRYPAKYNMRHSESSKLGNFPLSRLYVFTGAEGSGRRTYLRTFCAAEGINLIHVRGARGLRGDHLSEATRVAKQVAPAIIMFENCSAAIEKDGQPALHTDLHYEFAQICAQNYAVFFVFLVNYPLVHSQMHYDLLKTTHKTLHWVGVLNNADRMRCIKSELHKFLNTEDLPYNLATLTQISDAARDCTPSDIHDTIGACVARSSCGDEKVTPPSHAELLHEFNNAKEMRQQLNKRLYSNET